MRTDYIESCIVVGRGVNLAPDNSIIVEAGWDTEANLAGAVVMSLLKPLKNVRIQTELRGYAETRFESPHKIATSKALDKQLSKNVRIFQQIVEVVYDSKHPLSPNPNGTPISLPFSFKLPKRNMPPSFDSPGGTIEYFIKCTILFQEGMKLLKTNWEVEVPVMVTMPQLAIWNLLKSPSPFTDDRQATVEKLGVSVFVPKRILGVGENVELQVTIHTTPGNTKLRSMNASLRSVISYVNQEQFAVLAKMPRPIAEMSQTFPMLSVRPGHSDPIVRRIYLHLDPLIAKASLESPLISIKTVLRFQVVLDNSETPNIHLEDSYFYSVAASPLLRATSQTPSINESTTDSFLNILAWKPTTSTLNGSISSVPANSSSSSSNSVKSPLSTPIAIPVYDLPHLGQGRSLSRVALDSPQYSMGINHKPSQASIPARATPSSMLLQQQQQQQQQQHLHYHQYQTPQASPLPQLSSSQQQQYPKNGGWKHHLRLAPPPPPPPTTNQQHSAQADVGSPAYTATSPQFGPTSTPATASVLTESIRSMSIRENFPPTPPVDPNNHISDRRSIASGQSGATNTTTTTVSLHDTWTVDMVGDWLKRLGGVPAEVVQRFLENEIDGPVLVTLTTEDLRDDLGVTALGVRRKIQLAIERLRGGH
ncbi:hypothetical protein BDR26DRAFT_849978 [Obelidium mucronatum]|nr:hypothetical protein BDR26DRAFT_849978 [Obelidium mucronatum]